MANNPFNQSAPAAPAAPQAAPVAPAAAPAAVKEKKARKQPNRQMTADERKFVIENYATMNTSELAQKMGLTRQQVYRTVMDARKTLQKRLESLNSQPETAESKAMKAKIQGLLDRLPNKPFGGGAGGGGARKSGVENVLDDLLAGLE